MQLINSAPAPRRSRRRVTLVVATVAGIVLAGAQTAQAATSKAATPKATVTGVSSNAGPVSGGRRITLTGHGFVSGTTVVFGSAAGRSVRVESSTRLQVTTPRHARGTVRVNVRTPAGPAASALSYRFAALPAITAVAPGSALTGGGTVVTITGTGFDSTAQVQFGGTAGTGTHVVSTSTITTVAPAHTAGAVAVTVTTTAGGASAPVTASQLTYRPPLPVSALSITAKTQTSQTLSWTNPVTSDLAGVIIRRATGATAPASPTAGTAVALAPATAQSVTDTGLTQGQTYSYAVFARDGNGQYAAAVTITGTTVACVPAVVTVPAQTVTTNTTLTATCVSYYQVTGPVEVAAGVTLTLGAGTVVHAAAAGSLTVDGTLIANGTAKAPVVFSSVNDVTGSTPKAGDWPGIHVDSTGTATLTATTLQYAATALSVDDGADVVITGRILNSTVGVNSPDAVVDARNVDWGATSGPSPIGTGTPIVGAGVFALPWTGFVAPTFPRPAPTKIPPSSTTCANVLFIGARGSGEGPQGAAVTSLATTDRALLGARIAPILDNLTGDLAAVNPALTVRVEGLRYPALAQPSAAFSADLTPGYLGSIYAGVGELEFDLATEHSRCPGEKIVLAGYSQGALVVHLALDELATTGALASYPIAAVELVADPARTASDTDTRFGAADPHAGGLWPIVFGPIPLPASIAGVTAEICHADDAVCDATLPTAVTAASPAGYRINPNAWGGPHASYPVGAELDQLAAHAAALLTS